MTNINPAFTALLERPVRLIATCKGKVLRDFPDIVTAPEDWNAGHPQGAMFMGQIDVPSPQYEKPRLITGWIVRDMDGATLDAFEAGTGVVLQPRAMNRLERCVVVRRVLPEAVPAT